jgi:predicted GNAT family acetyltransferase
MTVLLYNSLLNIYEANKDNIKLIENIKNQYICLLSLLTHAPDISTEKFVNQIVKISKIGTIIVCYLNNQGDNQQNNITIIGSGTVIYEPKIIHGCQNVGHIEDIVVSDKYRGQGIAQNILRILSDYSFINNCYKVILDCKGDMKDFYEKNGLKETGIQMSEYIL